MKKLRSNGMISKAMFRKVTGNGKHFTVYVHPWEFDPNHPKMDAPILKWIRHGAGIHNVINNCA